MWRVEGLYTQDLGKSEAMTKQMEHGGMWWNCKEVYMSKWEWVIEVWGSGWKEAIMKASGVSGPMMWTGWVITGKEKISPRNKRIGVKHNITPLLSLRQWWRYLELVHVVCRFIVEVVSHFIGHSIINISQGWRMAMTSWRNSGGEVRFGSDHMTGALGDGRYFKIVCHTDSFLTLSLTSIY